jgi:hypothetical protein
VDKEKSMSKLEELFNQASARNYLGRRMVIELESKSDDTEPKNFRATGKMKLAVSEDKETWNEEEFEVMVIESSAEEAIASVLAHLNSIPMEYGDSIFEDGFFEIMGGELPDGKT